MAARFWVGGTGTWDASDTTHWASSSNGAGGQSVPGSADSVTFDGSSGGGTVTVNTTVTVTSITCGAFTGTLDFSANNNNVTLSGTTGFVGSGTGTRTLNLGNGTWTLTSNGAVSWDMTTTTNLTFNANSSTVAFTQATPTATRNFIPGGLTYNSVTFNGQSGTGFNMLWTGASTIATLTIAGNNRVQFGSGTTQTITNLVISGTPTAPVFLESQNTAAAATLTVTTATIKSAALRFLTFTNAAIAHDSFNLGSNTNVTIIPPGIRPGFSLGM